MGMTDWGRINSASLAVELFVGGEREAVWFTGVADKTGIALIALRRDAMRIV
jgi:hypothetical protein